MKGRKKTNPLDTQTLDGKSVEFLLNECGRLRADLIALSNEIPPPPPPPLLPDESLRIHGVVEKRFREFENSTKEELLRQRKKSPSTRIIRPLQRKCPQETKLKKTKDSLKTKTPSHLSTKLIKGVNIFPELSVEKLRSFEFVQARPKSNVGYYHFIHVEDQREFGVGRPHLVVQNTTNINISPEQMKDNESHDNDELSKSETDELKEISLKSSSVEWHNSTLRDEELSQKEDDKKEYNLSEDTTTSSHKSNTSYTLESSRSKSKSLTEDHSQKSDFSHNQDSAKSKNLNNFLLHADKSVIEKLPLDEKMKIIRRNLHTYEESELSGDDENYSKEEYIEEEPNSDSLCEVLRYALSVGESRSFLSTIEELTENEASFNSLSRRSLRASQVSETGNSNRSALRSCPSSDLSDLRSFKKASMNDKDLTASVGLSEGQFIQEGSFKLSEDLETDIDDDDASSSDTFTISVGEWK